jgi:hypothetical protein
MQKQEVLNHWRFFLSLEKDLLLLQNYVEFTPENFSTYSFEISKLLQLSCSEIDCVSRLLCNLLDPKSGYSNKSEKKGNIARYKIIIMKEFPKIVDTVVYLDTNPDHFFTPWRDWKKADSPDWWNGYNAVKHYRHSSFSEANLKNAITSMAALMVLIMYLYRKVTDIPFSNPRPQPVLFTSDFTSPTLILRADKELPDFEKSEL